MRGSPLQLENSIILETHDIGYYDIAYFDIGFLLIGILIYIGILIICRYHTYIHSSNEGAIIKLIVIYLNQAVIT